jgi:hypothetical protein
MTINPSHATAMKKTVISEFAAIHSKRPKRESGKMNKIENGKSKPIIGKYIKILAFIYPSLKKMGNQIACKVL